MKAEYDDLVNKKKPKILSRLSSSREQGDLAENSEYAAARDEMAFVDQRISELEEALRNAVVLKSKKSNGIIGLGSKVILKGPTGKIEYTLVSSPEADPLNGRISDESPLGKALLGKRTGDLIEIIELKIGYKVLEIK